MSESLDAPVEERDHDNKSEGLLSASQEDIRILAKEAAEIWEAADETSGSDEVMEMVIGRLIGRIHEAAKDAVFISRSEAESICKRLEYDASWDKCGSGYYRLKRSIAP